MKCNCKLVLLGAIAFTILAQVVHTISSALTMGWYTNPAYFGLWSKVMMPAAGPPPMSFFYLSIIFSFIVGMIFALTWDVVKKSLPGKGLCRGSWYGLLLFFVAGVPTTLNNFLLFNMPMPLLLAWTFLDGLAVFLLAGMAFSKISP